MSDDMIAQLRTKYCCAAWNEGCNCGDIADRIEAQAAEIERLRGIGLHLVQHINWVTNGLPDLLEDACLTDEEGVINAAIAAATEARAALGEME